MSTKQTFKIRIAGTDYSPYIMYPVGVTDKRLDESLNLCDITLGRMIISTPFKPNRQVILELYIDDVLEETESYLIISDVTTKIGFTDLYNHKLSLIEYTHLLSQAVLPNFTVTRIGGVYEPTLLDAAYRVNSLMNELTGLLLVFEQATIDILDAIASPEWTFTRQTALEAYRMIFSLAKIVPVANINESVGTDYMSHVEVSPDIAGAIEGFGFKQEAYNPETYKTALYSNVQNFVTGENDTITEPANGWLSVRSSSGFEIQEDNAMIRTSRPIYKLEKLTIARYITLSKLVGASTIASELIPYSVVPLEWYIEPDEFVYEKDYWNAKENTDEFIYNTELDVNEGQKGASLYYTQGKKNIENLAYIPPSSWALFPNRQALRNIIDSLPHNADGDLTNYIKPAYVTQAEVAALAYWENLHTPYNDVEVYWVSYSKNITSPYTGPSTFIGDLQFRVTYTPMIDTNLFTYRERKFDDDDEMKTFQVYNQTATVIDSDVLANLHDKVIKRGSGKSLNLTYLHDDYAGILVKGKRIDDYIITSNDIIYGYSGIKVIYNLDEYYAKLQKYVAVLEEYRQYSIPNENIVTRQLTMNRFAKFSKALDNTTNVIDVAKYIGDSTEEINLVRLRDPLLTNGAVLPATNFAFNSTLVFETTFESNASAGPQSSDLSPVDASTRIDTPITYVDVNGRIEKLMEIRFGTDFAISSPSRQCRCI
jgi:hypothetical protein